MLSEVHVVPFKKKKVLLTGLAFVAAMPTLATSKQDAAINNLIFFIYISAF